MSGPSLAWTLRHLRECVAAVEALVAGLERDGVYDREMAVAAMDLSERLGVLAEQEQERLMRKRAGVVAALVLLVASVAQAQTPVTTAQAVAFEQSDYGNVTRFEIRVDAGAWADVGKPGASGPTNTVLVPMPAMTPGPHTLTVRACNAAGCSAASAGLNVTMVAIPAVPANPRVVTPAQ